MINPDLDLFEFGPKKNRANIAWREAVHRARRGRGTRDGGGLYLAWIAATADFGTEGKW